MSIITECPECGKQLKAPDSAAGKRAKCPGCSGIVQIPAPEPAPGDDFLVDSFDDDDGFEQAPQRRRRPAPAGGSQRRPCPMCGEMIAPAARQCRFCGEDIGRKPGARRRDESMGVVRTGIIVIYYGLVTVLACAIFLVVAIAAMRGAGAPAMAVVLIVLGVGLIGGAIAMIVGKFFCLGVPASVGATGLIYAACGIEVLGILISVLRVTVGVPIGLTLASGVLGLVGTFMFLVFLKKLGEYIRRDKIVRLARTVIVMTSVTIGAYILFLVLALVGVAGALGGRPNVGMGGLLIILGLAVLIIGIVTLCLYGRLLTYLKDAL